MYQSLIEYNRHSVSVLISTIVSVRLDATEPSLIAPEQLAGYVVTAIFTALNIFVMYLILKRFVFKPIMRTLEKRRVSVEDEIKNAHENRIKSEEIVSESKHTLDHARTEAASVIDEAKIQAEKQAESIISQAKEQAKQIVVKANEDAKRTRTMMLEEVKDDVADLAVLIASRALGRVLDKDEQKALAQIVAEETEHTEVMTRD